MGWPTKDIMGNYNSHIMRKLLSLMHIVEDVESPMWQQENKK